MNISAVNLVLSSLTGAAKPQAAQAANGFSLQDATPAGTQQDTASAAASTLSSSAGRGIGSLVDIKV
jgi:hypothetical protein